MSDPQYFCPAKGCPGEHVSKYQVCDPTDDTHPTDEAITRALAEMAGYTTVVEMEGLNADGCEAWVIHEARWCLKVFDAYGERYFSPLTDWRDLGPLIEQYNIALKPLHVESTNTIPKWSAYHLGPAWIENFRGPISDNDDLKRAACLALYFAQEQEHD